MGKKGQWTKTTFIVETSGEYPKKIAVTTWKADQIPAVGDTLTCHLDLESREYNNRWYTDIRAWKIDGFTGNMKAAQASKGQKKNEWGELEPEPTKSAPVDTSIDDLPF